MDDHIDPSQQPPPTAETETKPASPEPIWTDLTKPREAEAEAAKFTTGYTYEKQLCKFCGEEIAENALYRHEKICEQATPEQRAWRAQQRLYAQRPERAQRDREYRERNKKAAAPADPNLEREKRNTYNKERYWRIKEAESVARIEALKNVQLNGAQPPPQQPQHQQPPPQPRTAEPPHKQRVLVTIAIDFDMLRTVLMQLGPEGISLESLKLV